MPQTYTAKFRDSTLEDAAWVTEDGEAVQITGPGVLLTKYSGIKTIHFLGSGSQS